MRMEGKMNKPEAYVRHISQGSLSRQELAELPVDQTVFIKIIILVLMLPFLFLLASSLTVAFLVIAGIAWAVWGIRILYLSGSSKHWPVTQGTIIENSVGRIVVPSRYGWYAESYPILAFRYTVDGVEYVSRKTVLFPGDLRVCDEPLADPPYRTTVDFCARYPMNSAVEVHYNPNWPRHAVLIAGALSRSWQHSVVFLVLGSFLVSLGLFLLYIR